MALLKKNGVNVITGKKICVNVITRKKFEGDSSLLLLFYEKKFGCNILP